MENDLLEMTISKKFCEELRKNIEQEIINNNQKIIYVKKQSKEEREKNNRYMLSYIETRRKMFNFIKNRANEQSISEINNDEWKQLSEQTKTSYQDLREKIKGINREKEIITYLGYDFKRKIRQYQVNCENFDEIELYIKLKQFVYLSRIFNFQAKNNKGERILSQKKLASIFSVKFKTIQFFENCFT